MRLIGVILTVLGGIVWTVFGLWGFVLCLQIVNYVAGFWGVIIGFAIAPVTFIAAPWYAGVQWGNWFPLILTYGGGILGSSLLALGNFMKGE